MPADAQRKAHSRKQNRRLAVLIPTAVCLWAAVGVKQGAYSFSELLSRPMVTVEWLDEELWKPPSVECRHGCWPKFVDSDYVERDS